MLDVLKDAWKGWNTHNVMQHAAALAYSALFALAPLLVLAISAMTLFLGQASAHQEIVARLTDFTGAQAAQTAVSIADHASHAEGAISLVLGLAFALVGSIGIIVQFESAVREIWEEHAVTIAGLRGNIVARLTAACVLVVALAAALVLGATDAALAHLSIISQAAAHAFVLVLAAVLAFAVFAVAYRTVPQQQPQWRHACVAALVTMVLVVLGQIGFAAYVRFVSFSSPYGAAGSIIVLLVWLYYSSLSALAGAELARAIAARYALASRP